MSIPSVDPSRAIVVHVSVQDLNSFFQYSLGYDGAPNILGFDARATANTTSLSGFYMGAQFVDDSMSTILTPLHDVVAFDLSYDLSLNSLIESLAEISDRNTLQSVVSETALQTPAENANVGPYTLSGAWSEVPGGDALLSLYNDLSSNGRIVTYVPQQLHVPQFIVGDALRYFVNISEVVDVGYYWSQSAFTTISSAQFAVTNFCAALIQNVSQGAQFTLSPGTPQVDVRNAGYVSNVVYSVTMVAMYE